MSAIEERIRKLLALADSPNENEAAEKAQALMLRYGIEMATIAALGGERLAVDEHVVGGKVDPWRRMLAAAVAHSAGGRVVWAPDGSGRSRGKIFFYGPAGAVGGMVELYRYLKAQLIVISAAATAARRERRVHGRTWRNSFLLGAVGRVGQRLDARRSGGGHPGSIAAVTLEDADKRELARWGLPRHHDDPLRGIEYIATPKLGAEHILASSAIPALFPAVRVTTPEQATGWYFDGGPRLNTPIKPALPRRCEKRPSCCCARG
jgi:hypothetical protein